METTAYPSSIPQGRRNLAAVARHADDLVRIDDAVSALGVTRPAATKLLWRWARQGWLRRVGPGTYAVVQLDSIDSDQVLDDPWVLVPALYAPAYVGGWTAAEHWDLTEQLFRPVVVMTTRPVHAKHRTHHWMPFVLRHIHPRKLFGTQPVWRSRTRVPVSDVHRTVVDLLDDPAVGGGSQHVADCLAAYLARDNRNDVLLIRYAATLGNGAVFKRLGFLAEQQGETLLPHQCRARLTNGYAKLDPTLPCSIPLHRWRLRIPSHWPGPTPRDDSGRPVFRSVKALHDRDPDVPDAPIRDTASASRNTSRSRLGIRAVQER